MDLLDPALRRAGITHRPGITSGPEKYAEMVKVTNRLLSSWNTDGAKIFTTKIEAFNLIGSQKQYSIGPGGDFNTTRPVFIRDANFIFPGSTALRHQIHVIDDDEFARISLQDIPGAPPWFLYYDGSYDANGRGQIFIIGQPPSGYQLELYSWQALSSSFTATSDAVIWPPGYEFALETNLGVQAAGLYPNESILKTNPLAMAELRKEAAKALQALIILNTECPTLRSEAAWIGRGGGPAVGASLFGGGNTFTWQPSLTTPDGIITDFVWNFAPVDVLYNGLTQIYNVGFTRPASNSIRLKDTSGSTVTPGVGDTVYGRAT